MRELVRHILDAAPELDEAAAERIAHRLHERPVSARAVADYLGLRKTDWVYANAERLGGFRLGEGERPRWRFYLSEVDERLREFCARTTPRATNRPKPKPCTPRRGDRRAGFTTAGNALLDFEAT